MRLESSRYLAAAAVGAALLAAAGSSWTAPVPTYAVTGRIDGSGGGWDYASFDPVHRRVYVSRTDGVSALEVDTGVLTNHLADGLRTHEPLVLPGGEALVVTNGGTSSVRMINAADGKLIAEIPTAPFPDGAVYDPASKLAVAFSAGGVATLIDPATKAAVGSITIGGKLEFPAADGHGRVFDNVESAGEIAVLDVKAKTVTARYKLPGCEGPGGLAYARQADVLITACGNGVAEVVAARTGEVLASLPIGKGPDAVIYDPERRLAFIPCGRDGVLEVIRVGKGSDAAVVQVVKTALGARLGAVDPKTGKLYLPTADFDPPAVAGGRPTIKLGSFHLVVVSPAG